MTELTAGRELDALVAERCMKWNAGRFARAAQFERDYAEGFALHGRRYWIMECQLDDYGVPFYSTDIAAAWQVVEHMREQGWWPMIDLRDAGWFCTLYYVSEDGDNIVERLRETPQAWADTVSEAICRAALKAVQA